MDNNLDALSDHQISLLLRAAGFSESEIAAMDRDAQEAALAAQSDDAVGDRDSARTNFPPAPEGEEEEYALLRHRGYTDQQISDMNDEEREDAMGEADPDMVTAALMREGYTEGEIAVMSDEQKMELIDPNDVMMYEALKEAGYTDEQIDSMSTDDMATALDKQTLLENEMLEKAGYEPDDLGPGARADALSEVANNPDDFMVLGAVEDDSERVPDGRPNPDDEDIDPEEEDPDDPEDDDLLEDEAATGVGDESYDDTDEPLSEPPSASGFSDADSLDPGWSEIDRYEVEETVAVDGIGRTEVVETHGGSTDGTSSWEHEGAKDVGIGIDGFHRGASTTDVVQDSFGLTATETSSDVGVGPAGANWDSESHRVTLGVDGTVETVDKERHAEADADGVSYARTRDHLVLDADGSITETGDRTEVSAGDDGVHFGAGRTNLFTDADGNVTGTDAGFDVAARGGELTLNDDFDTNADGGLLGDRGVSRHVDIALDSDGFDTSGDGSVTFAGRTVDVGHDLSIDASGISVEIGGVEQRFEAPADVLPDVLPDVSFPDVSLPDVSFPDVPPAEEVVADIIEIIEDVPPPPAPLEEAADAFGEAADDAGEALGNLFG